MTSTIQFTSRSIVLVAIVFLMSTADVETAQAQLFGARSLGQPLSKRPATTGAAASTMDSAGAVQGNERFLRGNRSRNDFVGSNQGSLQGFIGSDQAIGVGRVRTSVESLREPPDLSAQINRPMPPLARGAMYRPRLAISDSEMATASYTSSVATKRDGKLESLLCDAAGSKIQVSHQGDRTVLRGVVASKAIAEKLRILASFEPHIDTIENQLLIASPVSNQRIR